MHSKIVSKSSGKNFFIICYSMHKKNDKCNGKSYICHVGPFPTMSYLKNNEKTRPMTCSKVIYSFVLKRIHRFMIFVVICGIIYYFNVR